MNYCPVNHESPQNLRATGLIVKYVVTCNVYYVKSCICVDLLQWPSQINPEPDEPCR
jgi:hypothetical protein